MELAGNDADKRQEIKKKQLIGVEARSDMFTYACSNMMMRGVANPTSIKETP